MAQPMVSVFPCSQLLPLKMAADGGTTTRDSDRIHVMVLHRGWPVGRHLFVLVAGCLALVFYGGVSSLAFAPLLSALVFLGVAHLRLLVRIREAQKELTALRKSQEETQTVGRRVLALRKGLK